MSMPPPAQSKIEKMCRRRGEELVPPGLQPLGHEPAAVDPRRLLGLLFGSHAGNLSHRSPAPHRPAPRDVGSAGWARPPRRSGWRPAHREPPARMTSSWRRWRCPSPPRARCWCEQLPVGGPYMRSRMRERQVLRAAVRGREGDGRRRGGAVTPHAAASSRRAPGAGANGWREHYSPTARLFSGGPERAPISAALGVLGMPADRVCGPDGVRQAAGGRRCSCRAPPRAVGSAVGQMARLGAAGRGQRRSAEKVEWLPASWASTPPSTTKTRSRRGPREHCPKGIDIYFDNVGGDHLAAALAACVATGASPFVRRHLADNREEAPPGPDTSFRLPNRLTIRGFIVLATSAPGPVFWPRRAVVQAGELKYRRRSWTGIENMPGASWACQGENIGKMLVRVGPTRVGLLGGGARAAGLPRAVH